MSVFEEIKKKKFPYRITKTNWVLYLIACCISILFRLLTFEDIFEFIGNIIGVGIGYLLFASLFGFLFWFLLGKKENGGSTTFNVLIIIILLGQFGEFSRNLQKRHTDTNELDNALHQYKKELNNDSIPADIAFERFTATVEKNIDYYIEQSSGAQKELYLELKQFIHEAKQEGDDWSAAHSKISADSFFDFSILNNDTEIDNQIQIAEEYIIASNKYKKYFLSRSSKLKHIMTGEKINDEFAKEFLKGIERKARSQNPIFIPYINSNIQYGNKMKEVLLLLKKNKWKLTLDGYIEFKNSTIEMEFNDLITELTEIENKNIDLYTKLVDVM
jgi:hypothetical protein